MAKFSGCLTALALIMPTEWAVFLAVSRAEPSAPSPAVEFPVTPRKPLPLVFYSPTKSLAGEVNRSRVAALLDAVLAPETDLRPVLVDEQTVHDCIENPSPPSKGRMTCMVESARPDYEPHNRDGSLRSWSEVRDAREMLRGEPDPPPFMVVVVASRVSAEKNRLISFLLDAERALELGIHAARLRGEYEPKHMDELESYLVEHAVRAQTDPVIVGDEAEMRAYFEAFFQRDHRLIEVLRRAKHWWNYGVIEFETPVDGANILVDGVQVGMTLHGLDRLVRVTPGPHRVTLQHPDYLETEASADVKAGGFDEVSLVLVRRPNVVARTTREVTLWTGVGLFAAGSAVVVAQLASGPAKGVVCLHGPSGDPACGGSTEWLRSGQPSDPGPTESPNGSGLLLAPLGLSVAAGGLVLASGTYLIGDDDDLPWMQVLGGVCTGVATYALSALLNGHNAIDAAGYSR